MIDGADQEQKEDVIQHHRLLENHVSISQEGQVNHTHSVTLCYSPTCSLLSDIKIGLNDPVHVHKKMFHQQILDTLVLFQGWTFQPVIHDQFEIQWYQTL